MQTSLSEAGSLGNDFNKTLAVTTSKGASITFSGMGECSSFRREGGGGLKSDVQDRQSIYTAQSAPIMG